MKNLQSLRRSLHLLLVLMLFVATSHAQTTVRTEFAGQNVNLVIPTGYCVIPHDSKQGKPFYDLQTKGNVGVNIVGVLFADCEEWKHRVADENYLITRTGNYLFQLTDGKQALVPKGIARHDYIKAVAGAEFPQGNKLESTINTKFAKTGINTGTIGNTNLSVVDSDENALYFAVLTTIKYPHEDASRHLAGTIAITMINQVPASMNLYDTYQGEAALVKQIRAQQKVVRALIKVNSDGTNNSSR